MARVKIDETILEDVALTMSGGRLCLRWAADAWDGTLDSAAELLGVADELRELDADNMTVALYAVRGLASLRMDAEHAAMEAVLCVDPMEVGAAEKLGQQLEAQGRTLSAAIEAQSTALGKRIDGQEALLGAARVAARRTVAADADAMTADELSDCVPLFDAWDGSSVAYAVGTAARRHTRRRPGGRRIYPVRFGHPWASTRMTQRPCRSGCSPQGRMTRMPRVVM